MSICYPTVPDSCKCLRAPVKKKKKREMDWQLKKNKKTGNGLAAGCQLFYRKIYGYFFAVWVLWEKLLGLENCTRDTYYRNNSKYWDTQTSYRSCPEYKTV